MPTWQQFVKAEQQPPCLDGASIPPCPTLAASLIYGIWLAAIGILVCNPQQSPYKDNIIICLEFQSFFFLLKIKDKENFTIPISCHC